MWIRSALDPSRFVGDVVQWIGFCSVGTHVFMLYEDNQSGI